MFHGNLVHGSAPNITPYPRRIVYLTLCAVSNYIRTPTRPEWIAHRDFTPIEPVADDALLNCARSYYKRAAASFTSINAKSPRDPSGWSKNRSTSESSRASPRAVEPNR
jgi:hypothetical protein